MGILSRLLRQNVPVSADSGVLREQLFGAVAAGDQRSFKKLCRKNADQIVGRSQSGRVFLQESGATPPRWDAMVRPLSA